jgi:hypothetical protein
MKLPLWIKNKEGKYAAFPYADRFTTFSDGKCGVEAKHVRYSDLRLFWQHVFIYDIRNDRFLLRETRRKYKR